MSDDIPTARPGRCPICRKDTVTEFRPFCSRACANVDLMRWLKGGYAISGGEADADEDGDDSQARHASTTPTPEDDAERP